jgi:hypothetical protein
LHERVGFLLLVALCAVEPFSAWGGTGVILASKDGIECIVWWDSFVGVDVENVQHGDRIETWALRMCLLDTWLAFGERFSIFGFAVCRSIRCVPHGEVAGSEVNA